MSTYDDLFDVTAPDRNVFTEKAALDSLAPPAEIDTWRTGTELATILNDVHEGYLPTTLSIDGSPSSAKTLTNEPLNRMGTASRQRATASAQARLCNSPCS